MAKYKIAQDGHPYLTHGYALIDELGKETARFATYQVNPGAERLFERVGFEEGDNVSQETFYALLLDGDLYNYSRPNGIDISAVPNSVLLQVNNQPRIQKLNLGAGDSRVYLLDIYEVVEKRLKKPKESLFLASWLCIHRHYERSRSGKKSNSK